MHEQKPVFLDWLLLIILTIIWGFSYYFIKHSLTDFNPTQVASLRMVISALALCPFLPWAFRQLNLNNLSPVIIVAVVGSLLPAFLYPFAQQKISSSVAGIVNAFTPICTFAIGIFFFKLKNEKSKQIGTLIALAGALCLVVLKPTASLHAEAFYLFVAFSVPVLYGFNGNIIKSKLSGIPGIPLTAMIYFIALLVSIPLAWISGAFEQIPKAMATGNSFYHLLALSLLGSALAMTLFNILVQRVHVLFAASVTYLMPIVSLVVGYFDDEKIGLNDLMGLLGILTGVLIINGVIKPGLNK